MDPELMGRAARRRQAEEALESERDRERLLLEELEDLHAEGEGQRIDEGAFAAMDADAVALVRSVFDSGVVEDDDEEEDAFEDVGFDDDQDDPGAARAEEIRRLEAVLLECRRKQQALEQYLAALG